MAETLDTIAQADAGDESDCAFFDPWRQRPINPETVGLFPNAATPLAEVELRCVPPEWLLLAILLDCGDDLQLSDQDLAHVVAEFTARLPTSNELCETRLAAYITPEAMPCLVESLFSPDATVEDRGRVWAWALVSAFGAQGDILAASPEVVAALQALMLSWPLSEDAWWTHLWAGFPEGSLLDSVNVRLAIFEALHGVLSEGEWLHRMSSLAGLERLDSAGGAALYSMGACLGRHLDSEQFASLLAEPGGDGWMRALVMGFPDDLKWPSEGHGRVSMDVMQALIEMRDSSDYEYRLDIIQYQWQLLGPVEAMIDMERFIFEVPSTASEWDWEAAMRVSAAIDAIRSPGWVGGSAASLSRARDLVRELFVTPARADSRAILVALRDRWWNGGSSNLRRQELANTLGPQVISGLDAELQSWLQSP